MAIPNFQQQSQSALRSGLDIGGALQNAETLRLNREQQQQQQGIQAQNQEFNLQQQPLKLRQMEAQATGMEQQNERADLLQTAMLLASIPEKDGKQLIPEMINKYQGNEPVLAALRELYQSKGVDYISKTMSAVQAFGGKSAGGKDTAPSKVKELEAAGYVRGTPEFQEAMKSLIFKDTEGMTSLKASDVKGINSDVTAFVKPWKEVYRAAKDLDALGKAKTPAGQMAMIFKFMKALDPASTVRETEFQAAQNTTGMPDRIFNMVQKASSGIFLSEKQVKEFVDTAKIMSNSRAENVTGEVNDYLAPYGSMIDDKRRAAFLNRASTKMFDVKAPEPITATPASTTPQVGEESDGYRFIGGDPSLPASWEKI